MSSPSKEVDTTWRFFVNLLLALRSSHTKVEISELCCLNSHVEDQRDVRVFTRIARRHKKSIGRDAQSAYQRIVLEDAKEGILIGPRGIARRQFLLTLRNAQGIKEGLYSIVEIGARSHSAGRLTPEEQNIQFGDKVNSLTDDRHELEITNARQK